MVIICITSVSVSVKKRFEKPGRVPVLDIGPFSEDTFIIPTSKVL